MSTEVQSATTAAPPADSVAQPVPPAEVPVPAAAPSTPVPAEDVAAGQQPTAAEKVAAAETVETTKNAAAGPVPRRFLAGQTTAEGFTPRLPGWFFVFLLALGTGLLAVAAVALLLMPVRQKRQQPALACLVVDHYRLPGLHSPPWAMQNARRLQQAAAASMQPVMRRPMTAVDRADVEGFFSDRLADLDAETAVIYLAARGVSNGESAALLPADAAGDHPDNGWPVSRLVDALLNMSPRNVLLLLEVDQSGDSGPDGLQQQLFVHHLRKALKQAASHRPAPAEQAARNLWILLPADDGQPVASSVGLAGTPFILAASDGLRGLSRIDGLTAPVRDSAPADSAAKPDGTISVAELAEYIRRGVGNWSLDYRSRLQTPVVIRLGDDFPLVDVNPRAGSADVASTSFASVAPSAGTAGMAGETPVAGTAVAEPPANGAEQDAEGDSATGAATTAPGTAAQLPTEPTPPNATPLDATAPDAGNVAAVAELPADETSRVALLRLAGEIREAWRSLEEFQPRQAAASRPAHWCALQQSLMRAEQELLRGRTARCREILDREFPEQLRRLTAELPEVSTNPDSTVTAEISARIAAALEHPDSATLAFLQESDALPARMLSVLAGFLVTDGRWQHQDAVRLAINTAVTKNASGGQLPEVLLLSGGKIAAAGRHRASALALLITGRHADALGELQQVHADLELISREAEEAGLLLHDVQQMLLALPGVFDWQSRLPASTGVQEVRNECHRLNQRLSAALRGWLADPQPQQLRELHRATVGLQRLVEREAAAALEPMDQQRALAVLQMTLLSADSRYRLLSDVLSQADRARFRLAPLPSAAVATGDTTRDDASETTAELLGDYCQILAVLSPHTSGGWSQLAGRLATTETGAAEQRSVGAARRFGQSRTRNRPSAAEEFATLLRRMRSGQLAAQVLGRRPHSGGKPVGQELVTVGFDAGEAREGEAEEPLVDQSQNVETRPQDWWRVRFADLATAGWVAGSGEEPHRADATAMALDREVRGLLLRRQIEQMAMVERVLPAAISMSRIHRLEQQLARLQPEQKPLDLRPAFSLTGQRLIEVPVPGTVTVPLTVRVERTLPGEATARLILNWNPRTSGMRLAVDGVPATGGQLERTLDASTAGQEVRFQLSVSMDQRAAAAAEAPAGGKTETSGGATRNLTARIEHSGGRIEWLPVEVRAVPVPVSPARLELSWQDHGAAAERVDLYPNQQIPLNLTIDARQPLPGPLQLTLQSGPSELEIPLPPVAAAGRHPVPLPPEFQLPFGTDRLVVQLSSDGELLDEQQLQVAVLDLNQCLSREIAFDPRHRQLTVRLAVLQSGDVPEPLPAHLELWHADGRPAGQVQGTVAGLVPPDGSELRLTARMPPDMSVPVSAALSVAGVPRVFRFRAGPQHLTGEAVEKLGLRFLQPRGLLKRMYQAGRVHLPLELEADGSGELAVAFGIDANRNGRLDDFERQTEDRFWRGRETRVELAMAGKPPRLVLRSVAGYVVRPAEITGQSGHIRLLARARSGTQSVTAAVELYVLRSAPGVQLLAPAAASIVGVGEPLRVTLRADADAWRAIDRLETGFDLDGDGLLGPKEIVLPVGAAKGSVVTFADGPKRTLTLPTDQLKRGSASLLARAVTVLPPPAGASPDDPKARRVLYSPLVVRPIVLATTGTVRGRVLRTDGSPARNAVVELAAAESPDARASRSVQADAMGNFVLDEVPAGRCRVVARTPGRSGSQMVVVRAGRTVTVAVPVQFGRAEP